MTTDRNNFSFFLFSVYSTAKANHSCIPKDVFEVYVFGICEKILLVICAGICWFSCFIACSATELRDKRRKSSGRRNPFIARATLLMRSSRAVNQMMWSSVPIENIDVTLVCHCAVMLVVVDGWTTDAAAAAALTRVSCPVRSCAVARCYRPR